MTHDTRNVQAPTTPVGALPGPISDLLAAVVEALDVPLADRPADDQARTDLLTRRAADVRVICELLLTHGMAAHSTARLREWTAEHPVTYPTWQARAEQAAAEEQQILEAETVSAAVSKGSALVRTPGGDQRCPAAHPEDPDPCGGPVVVTVLDATNASAKGCEHHGARLLASLEGGRVYGLPDAPEGAAIRVFKSSASIRPFPWIDGPRTTLAQLSRAENRLRGEGQ